MLKLSETEQSQLKLSGNGNDCKPLVSGIDPAAATAAIVKAGRCRFKLSETSVESACCQRLKPTSDETVSNFAFDLNLSHYVKAVLDPAPMARVPAAADTTLDNIVGRGLHSSSFQLNASALRVTGGVVRGCFGGV